MKKLSILLFLSLVSLAGGSLNGLLGTGGGIIFSYMYKYLGHKGYMDPRDCFISSMATVLPISLLSLGGYTGGYFSGKGELFTFMLFSGCGGLIGAYLSSRVRPVILEKIFALLVIYAGIRMVL